MDPSDFFTYPFADSHPECRWRAQKLRVSEVYRVPRLFGFSMPSSNDQEAQGMFKSVLFRPLRVCRLGDDVEPFMSTVDDIGRFAPAWRAWYARQRLLVRRFVELQERAGKLFTIGDVDVHADVSEEAHLSAARLRPTAQEFMAAITVQVATNLDVAAEARGRSRRPLRPRAEDFNVPELDVPQKAEVPYVEPEENSFGALGEVVDIPVEEWSKEREARVPIPQEALQRVAFFDDANASSRLQEYKREFLQGLGHAQRPGCSGPDASSVFAGGRASNSALADALKEQERLFDHKRKRGAGLEGDDDDAPVGASRGRLLSHSAQCGQAYWATRSRAARPSDFVQQRVQELASRDRNPIVLGAEQQDFLALIVSKVEEVLQAHEADRRGDSCGEVEQSVVLLLGQGGSGKTEVLRIAREAVEEFLGGPGSVAVVASSNSAARVVGGDTVHSWCHMHSEMGLSLQSLSRGVTDALVDDWHNVFAVILDEVSMVSPKLLGAASYRMCLARRRSHGADPDLYTESGHRFGKVPLVVLAGDFMQLPPFEGKVRVSLCMSSPSWAKLEHLNGLKLFWEGITDVVLLPRTFRFLDRSQDLPVPCPWLPRLFEFMREPETFRRKLPDDLWGEIQRWQVRGAGDPRLQRLFESPGTVFELAIAWEAVGRLMQYRALRDAQAARQVLVYVQAIDVPIRARLSGSELYRALQVVSMTTTGNRLGLLPLYVGQRVRLTAKLSARHKLVQDAVGEVVDFLFDDMEFQDPLRNWVHDDRHAARRDGYVRLQYMPRGVLVRFDGYEADVGYGIGVAVVRPMPSRWKYDSHFLDNDGVRRLQSVNMKRVQLPLAPEPVRTVQTAQGMSIDKGVMFLSRPGTMGYDDWWFHVYVMLSRVRTSKNLLVFGLPPKDMFTRGPPEWVCSAYAKFRRLAKSTADRTVAIRKGLDWPRAPVTASEPEEQRVCAPTPTSERRTVASSPTADVGRVDRDTSPPIVLPGVAVGGDGLLPISALSEVAEALPETLPDEAPFRDDSGVWLPRGRRATRPSARRPARSSLSRHPDAGSVPQPRKPAPPQVAGLAQCVSCEPASLEPLQAEASSSAWQAPSSASGSNAVCETSAAEGQLLGAGPGVSGDPAPAFAVREFAASTAPSRGEVDASLLMPQEPSLLELLYNIQDRSSFVDASTLFASVAASGIANLGNTCFASASLQVFLRVRPFVALLQAHHGQCLARSSCAACSLYATAAAMGEQAASRARAAVQGCPAARAARDGAFGPAFAERNVQCDAHEFVVQLQQALRSVEVQALSLVDDASPLLQPGGAFRPVMTEQIWGMVVRVRKCCSSCFAVRDTLEWADQLALTVVGSRSASLQGLWAEKFGCQVGPDLRCPSFDNPVAGPLCRGDASVSVSHYLEREPRLLVIALNRGWARAGRGLAIREGKDSRAIDFPEELGWLRSGPYRLVGVVRHIGNTTRSGHYVAHCWLRTRDDGEQVYGEFDDSVAREHGWSRLAREDVRREAYMLVYARVRYWSGSVGDGSESTPYARDPDSIAASQRVFRGVTRAPAEVSSSSSSSSASVLLQVPSQPPPSVSSRAFRGGAGHAGGFASSSSSSSASVAPQASAQPASLPFSVPSEQASSASSLAGPTGAAPAAAVATATAFPEALAAAALRTDRLSGDACEPAREAGLSDGDNGDDVDVIRPGQGAGGSAEARARALQDRFSPRDVDASRCLARLVRDGVASQCRNWPVKGSQLCKQHKPARGKARARYGLVADALPEDAVPELSAIWEAEQAGPRERGVGVADGRHPDGAAPALTRQAVPPSWVPPPACDVAASSRRPRIVTGFGAERVEDVAADEARRWQEGAQRGSRRRDAGERGRAVDFHGNELDRSAGGAWHAGRR